MKSKRLKLKVVKIQNGRKALLLIFMAMTMKLNLECITKLSFGLMIKLEKLFSNCMILQNLNTLNGVY
jgi:hypothetical protein